MTTRQVAIRVQTEGKAEVKKDFAELGQAGVGAQDAIAAAADKAAAASDRQMARWKTMAAAAKEADVVAQRQASFNALLGVGATSGKSAQDSASVFGSAPLKGAELNRIQQMMLQSAGFRSFESLVSGAPLSRIALQQGGEVVDALGMGQGGIGGALSMLQKLISPTVVGLTALTAVIVSGGVAALSYGDALKKLDIVAAGLGSTAGLSGAQIEALAETSAKLGKVSISSARDMATSYVSTGRIGGEVTSRLIAMTRDYALATGQDATKATAELAKAFADPAKGADELNGKLHFLDDTTYRYIQTLISQNRTTDAQNALLDALGPKVLSAAGTFNTLGESAHRVANFFQDMFTWYGKLVDRMASGGSVAAQIEMLQRQRALLTPAMLADPITARLAQALDAQISAMQERQLAAWKAESAGSAAATNQVLADARTAMGAVDGLGKKLQELQSNRAKIVAGQQTGALTDADVRAASADLIKVDKEIAAVKAGYGSAAEQAAAFKRGQSEAAAEARKAAEEAKKLADQLDRQEAIFRQNQLSRAKIFGDRSAIAAAEENVKVVTLTKQYQDAGLTVTRARALAERDVGIELAAQNAALVKSIELDAQKMVSTVELQKRLAINTAKFDQNYQALESFKTAGVGVFDAFATSLEANGQGWKSWGDAAKSAVLSVISELQRLAIINPLENALFGNVAGYTAKPAISGIGGFVKSLFGHNANGTNDWQGGLSWVGERGPELLNLPRGSQVFSAADSAKMAGSAAPAIHITVNAPGAVSREEIVGMVKEGVRQANASVPAIVNDGIKRRIIG